MRGGKRLNVTIGREAAIALLFLRPEDGSAALQKLSDLYADLLVPGVKEHWLYSITLLERVNLGTLTYAQATFLQAQDASQRLNAVKAQEQQQQRYAQEQEASVRQEERRIAEQEQRRYEQEQHYEQEQDNNRRAALINYIGNMNRPQPMPLMPFQRPRIDVYHHN